MFAPTACVTPTRLPTLMWSLAAAMLLLSAFAPAFASEHDATGTQSEEFDLPGAGGWRVLPLEQTLRATLLRRTRAAPPRLLPLAVRPSPRSAWWFGLGGSRSDGARIELRWTMPPDGGAPDLSGIDG